MVVTQLGSANAYGCPRLPRGLPVPRSRRARALRVERWGVMLAERAATGVPRIDPRADTAPLACALCRSAMIPEWGAAAGVRLDAWPRARRLLRRIDVRVVAATNRSLVTVRAQMRRHDWPGNVRELRNFVERTVVLRDGHMETAAAADPSAIDLDRSFRDGKEDVITQYERRYLEALLASTGGMSLCRLMQRHGVKPSGA